jgi:hypothetical protein
MVGAAQFDRSNVMKRLLTLASGIAATVLCSFSVHAGCVDPRMPGIGSSQQMPQIVLPAQARGNMVRDGDAASAIVGTWLVSYTANGAASGQAYIQWHSDGTEWENINFPVDGGNLCMGSWKAVDAKHVYRNHYGWLYTNGTVSGCFNETETNKVSRKGTYSGTNDTKIYDLNGNLQTEFTGNSAATLISP